LRLDNSVSTPVPPTTYSTLSLHDALPILSGALTGLLLLQIERTHVDFGLRAQARDIGIELLCAGLAIIAGLVLGGLRARLRFRGDRKSTRLNSSHEWISYAVFCLSNKNV